MLKKKKNFRFIYQIIVRTKIKFQYKNTLLQKLYNTQNVDQKHCNKIKYFNKNMFRVNIIVKMHSLEFYFPRRFNTNFQNYTFFFIIICFFKQ